MAESTSPDPSSPSVPDSKEPNGPAPSATRREAVARLGTYAAYTAPALVALLTATQASADS